MFHMGKGDMRPEATPRLRPLVLYLNIASLLESGWGSVSTKSTPSFAVPMHVISLEPVFPLVVYEFMPVNSG
jgi:hypothetical protein